MTGQDTQYRATLCASLFPTMHHDNGIGTHQAHALPQFCEDFEHQRRMGFEHDVTLGGKSDPCTVSVVILSHNSGTLLRRSVKAALELDWPDLEIIVVDNASTDDSPHLLEAEFGDRVRVIRRTVNSPTAGRNQGFHAARGKFVISLDDDIVLSDNSAARKGVALFRRYPDVGLLAFKITSIQMPDEPLPEHWWHPIPLKEGKDRFFYTDFFCEAAVFLRKDAIRATGGYDELLFQYFEGNDLALKLIREGFSMLFCPVLSCYELRVRGFQDQYRTRRNYLSLRNKLWIVWKHYPLWRAATYSVGRIAVAAVRSVRYGWLDYFWHGMKEGIFAPRAIRSQRRPLDKGVWKKITRIRQGAEETICTERPTT